tara:strand:- start:793 stop:1053 length:261 start_codon:yes stop_codon:yes gene_type:complete
MLAEMVMKLLPVEYRNLIEVGLRIVSQLDTSKERSEALTFVKAVLADGKCTPGEWAQIGSKLGILRGPTSKEMTGYGKKSRKKAND